MSGAHPFQNLFLNQPFKKKANRVGWCVAKHITSFPVSRNYIIGLVIVLQDSDPAFINLIHTPIIYKLFTLNAKLPQMWEYFFRSWFQYILFYHDLIIFSFALLNFQSTSILLCTYLWCQYNCFSLKSRNVQASFSCHFMLCYFSIQFGVRILMFCRFCWCSWSLLRFLFDHSAC